MAPSAIYSTLRPAGRSFKETFPMEKFQFLFAADGGEAALR
jgi:hypothetical protein